MRRKLILLADIAHEFHEARIRWAVGASLMLYLRGVASRFGDIDIFVEEADADAAKDILLRHGKLLPAEENSAFRTRRFLQFDADGIEIDLLAGFAVVQGGIEHAFPFEENCDTVRVLDEEVPLQSLGRWRECYAAMGRTEKLRMVDEALARRSRPWLDWAAELQAIAQNGLTYGKDIYDIERYTRLREISAEMLAHQGEIPLDRVKSLFCGDSGYQTPKLDTRAAIIEGGKILLVQERDGRWALPGGWVDMQESIASNTAKEVREEAGLDVRPLRIVAVQDRKKHNLPVYAYNVCKVFMLCERLGGSFAANSETTASGWFSLNALPPLAEEKCTAAQIALCFAAAADENWKVQFD